MEISRLLDERPSLIFSDFLLADEVFQFLVKNPTLLLRPDLYLAAILDSSSPLFQIGSTLAISLIPNAANLKNYQGAIDLITLNAAIESAIPVSSAFYDAMIRNFAASEVPHRFEIQYMRQNAELFMLSPSVANSQSVSKTLIDESEFFDSLSTVLFARLLKIEHGFMFVLLVAKKYFASAPTMERQRFVGMLQKAELKPKSRATALLRMTEGKMDEAFLFSAAESDDETTLAAIDRTFVRVRFAI
jgi:hypothetical protein